MDNISGPSILKGTPLAGQAGDTDQPTETSHEHSKFRTLIINPAASHTHTFIILHGRGSNGPKFGTEFAASSTATGETLPDIFPSAKWIFPTATKRRAVLFKRMPINQWFDIYDINNQTYREHLQVDGLQETTAFVHGLIEEEIRNGIPADRIVVGGLSQGCAASLYAMLCYKQRLGGYFGMCGWLPFAKYVEEFVGTPLSEDGTKIDDVFGASEDEEGTTFEDKEEVDTKENKKDPAFEAIGFLKDNITFPKSQEDTLAVFQTPVFLGHGVLDEKVPFRLGEQARDALVGLGFKTTWKAYDDLGHWYKVPDEIDHIRDFLRDALSTTAGG
ncbi:hypothetical protein TWF718_002409 [Orbilia javanica]|uniref:Phospholipase/carboxylesterase/thioesterase domain-containing protein n=1 Tax=Orbilia javanica TaxID=47235 RepID=A0AAN8MK21_9PEZI